MKVKILGLTLPKSSTLTDTNMWRVLKEKLREKIFSTILELEKEAEKGQRNFSKEKCENMMDDIPYGLQLIINNNEEHVHRTIGSDQDSGWDFYRFCPGLNTFKFERRTEPEPTVALCIGETDF